MKRKLQGFTLIELLIVVAIIAILAAIAVPNFLEAQVRSKVSRVKNDHRTLATAIESYKVDNNVYPAMPLAFMLAEMAAGRGNVYDIPMKRLSTPIAYISDAWFQDPFSNERPVFSGGASHYFYWNYSSDNAVNAQLFPNTILNSASGPISYLEAGDIVRWSITSSGPDQISNYQLCVDAGGTFLNPCHPNNLLNAIDGIGIYDPTNGTISNGDIRRNGTGQLERRMR